MLNLADVYSVLGYCLRHSTEVQAYLAQRRAQTAVVHQQNEMRFDPVGVRERLLARQVQDDRHPFTNPHPAADLNPVNVPLSMS